MWKTFKALVFGLTLFVASYCGLASAQVTTKTPLNSTSWVSVGTGPLFLSSIGQAWYAIGSSIPSLAQEGFLIPDGGVPVNTTTTVWARVLDVGNSAAAYAYPLVNGTFSGTFAWPGSCGNGVIAAAATAGCSVPYINAYIIGGGGGSAGPLGIQPINNSQAVNPATASTWPVQNAPPVTLVTGTITAADPLGGTVLGSGQTQYTGTPVANSTVSTAVSAAGDIEVTATISGGTASVLLHMEISQDNVNWYGRGLFLDGNNAPIWINGISGGGVANQSLFSGVTSGTGIDFYRVRAYLFTVLSGTPVVTVVIKQSNRNSGVYALSIPTAANGSGSVAAVNIQGNGSGGLPVNTNAQQQAGQTLAAPTAVGTPAASGLVPTVNVGNAAAATVNGFTPTGNVLSAPLAPGTGAVSSVVAPTGGGSLLLTNTGTTVGYLRLSVGSGTATANDIPLQPGGGCVLVLNTNTWVNIYNPVIGASINAAAGSGLGSCPTGGGGGVGGGSSGNVFQANLFVPNGSKPGTGNSVGAVEQFAASGSLTTYLVNYSVMMDADNTGNAGFQIVSGTGTNCATATVPLTPVMKFGPGNGIGEGPIGVLNASAPGAALCAKLTMAVAGQVVSWRIGAVQQ